MIRIWLNHWFSTAYSIIQLIKKDESDFWIIGSNEREQAVYKEVCDEWHVEPVLEDEEYVSFCLDFCMKNKVNIFAPRRKMVAISKHKKQFEKIGVKVLIDDYEIVNMLNQKDLAYKFFEENSIGIVPDYYSVTTAEDFLRAYDLLKEKYDSLCFKFVNDEGGKSYRRIVERENAFSELKRKQGSRITIQKAYAALSEVHSFDPIIIMPYLPGDEISVDCLKTTDGIITIPRYKDSSRIERIKYDPNIINYCLDFYSKAALDMPCNIQFKYLGDVPYILEVNTRMSGGVQMSYIGSGVNIPNIAINKLLNRHKSWQCENRECAVTHAEIPILM